MVILFIYDDLHFDSKSIFPLCDLFFSRGDYRDKICTGNDNSQDDIFIVRWSESMLSIPIVDFAGVGSSE